MSIQAASTCVDSRESIQSNGVAALLALWITTTMLLWLLAFINMPSGSAEWLRRTQVACFGSDESGLPSASGWLILTLGPLMFLSGLVVALPRECGAALRKFTSGGLARTATALLAGLVCAEGAWVGLELKQRLTQSGAAVTAEQLEHLPSNYPTGDSPAADFELIDQTGKPLRLSAFKGRPIIVSFVFAHCQAVCPTLVHSVTAAHRATAADKSVAILITLDPWRDTPAALPQLAEKWQLGPDEFILSGDPDAVSSILDAYGMPRERDNKNGDVIHPAIVKVIDKNGTVAYTFNGPTSIWLEDALHKVSR